MTIIASFASAIIGGFLLGWAWANRPKAPAVEIITGQHYLLPSGDVVRVTGGAMMKGSGSEGWHVVFQYMDRRAEMEAAMPIEQALRVLRPAHEAHARAALADLQRQANKPKPESLFAVGRSRPTLVDRWHWTDMW